jgi:hypothetical protein
VATTYNKPDLNAPRYRPKKLNLTNKEVHKQFLNENPRFGSITITEFKDIIKSFNGKIWNKVIDKRDGVELPEQLGYIFIGSCPRKKGENTDYKLSGEYGVKIQNQNWESDQYTAKIFYTNFESKYRFKHHEMWAFTGLRDFKRTVAKTYPIEWKKYVQVDDLIKVSLLFRKQKFQDFKKQETEILLEEYDEFNLD